MILKETIKPMLYLANPQCMSKPLISISISDMVSDFLFIQVKDEKLSLNLLEYHIINEEHQVVRKGQFRGEIVQLRITHLPQGSFELKIFEQGICVASFNFNKKIIDQSSENIESDLLKWKKKKTD